MSSSKTTTICFIHGWGAQNSVWQAWIDEHFAQLPGLAVQLIELPGFGKALPVSTEFSVDKTGIKACNQIWLQRLAAEIPANSVLVGWSLGGILAQQLVEMVQAKALVCIASTPKFVQAENWQNAVEQEVMQDFIEALEADSAALLKRFSRLQFQGDAKMRELVRKFNQSLENQPQPDLVALKQGLQLLAALDLRSNLANLEQQKIPSLWIFGEEDRLIPPETANQVQKILPSAKIARFAQTAHLPFYTEPAVTSDEILQFINQI